MCQRTSKCDSTTSPPSAVGGGINSNQDDIIVIDSDEEDERKPAASMRQQSNIISLLNAASDDDSSVELIDSKVEANAKKRSRRLSIEQSDREFAKQLQRQEKQDWQASLKAKRSEDERGAESDRLLAQRIQQQENSLLKAKRSKDERGAESDRLLAQRIQQQEENSLLKKASPNTELKEMTSSTFGKAVLAVQEVISFVDKVKKTHPILSQYNVDTVAQDDMVFLAKQMLDLREDYKARNIPCLIDIGYHYTNQSSMVHIRTNGLLTKADRESKSVNSSFHGSVFGDGIYTSENPTAFQHFGDVGLIVGRLQGKAARVSMGLCQTQINDANTVIGDKTTSKTDYHHEVVLRTSSQCLPMIRYDKAIVSKGKDGLRAIGYLYVHLEAIINRLFNDGAGSKKKAVLVNVQSSDSKQAAMPNAPPNFFMQMTQIPIPVGAQQNTANLLNSGSLAARFASSARVTNAQTGMFSRSRVKRQASSSSAAAAPASGHVHNTNVGVGVQPTSLRYVAPSKLNTAVNSSALREPNGSFDINQDCAICMDPLSMSRCLQITACSHIFHENCIGQALKVSSSCPVCRKSIGKPQGSSPSGSMIVSTSALRCAGFETSNTIAITYNIPAGPQMSYHINPGQRQHGKHAIAYLPNNFDGQNLLKRLKYAFVHGLTFTVGSSMTTNAQNQCTWSSIHHKTQISGGIRSHGFPDPNYFTNCNKELDTLNVPPANLLDNFGSEKLK